MRRPAVLLLVLAAPLALAACSSSPSTTSSSTSPPAASPAGSSRGSAHVPAVTNATNLAVQPVIAAGTPPPPDHLVVKNLVVGTRALATASSTVKVQYVGSDYATGKVFDSSWAKGMPATFALSGVVPGFAEGIEGMRVGGRREIVIPPSLGYGATGSPPAVGPNETLVFVVDLLAVT